GGGSAAVRDLALNRVCFSTLQQRPSYRLDHSLSTRSANYRYIRRQRQLIDSETSRAGRSVPSPAKCPIQTWRSGSRPPRCKPPGVFPLVRERPPINLLAWFPLPLSWDNFAAVPHVKRQTQLPAPRATTTRNHPMKVLSPWRANAAARAPASIKTGLLRQFQTSDGFSDGLSDVVQGLPS